MLSVDSVKNQLKDRRISIVSEKTGLSERTITDIRDGKNTNPKINTLNALMTYFETEAGA